jgi:hypothetical protein
VWRRDAIEDAGGWTGDTLTEDLDLSVRCALKAGAPQCFRKLKCRGVAGDGGALAAPQARWTKAMPSRAQAPAHKFWVSDLPLAIKATLTFRVCQFSFSRSRRHHRRYSNLRPLF